MDLGIKGKTALVTASTRGLGRGCAEALADAGCRVAICSRNENSVVKAAHDIAHRSGTDVIGLECDVGRKDDIEKLIQKLDRSIGMPDILVTNAGGPPPGTFETTAISDYDRALELNLMSAVHLINHVYPAMKTKSWGRIIAITSISVKQPISNLLLSNMARAGLTGFLKTIATELAPYGITVNALLPGTHKTSRIDQLVRDRAIRENKSEEEIYHELIESVPCKTIGEPADFGAAAAFLASRQACYITGHNLLIDGGKYGGLL